MFNDAHEAQKGGSMTQETLVVRDERLPLTAKEVKASVQLIQEVMKAVMKPDTHYGKIPGTDKPTLYKAGAEKILSTFKIGVEPIVEDLSTADEARYRVTAKGFSIVTGLAVGSGVGEASSNEEKYKWRKALCDAEYDQTPEDRRRIAFKRWDGKINEVKQVRVNHADVANTILKMAKKRAQIDMTLTVTAASDVFAQDLEDLPDGIPPEDGAHGKREPITEPQKKSDEPKKPTEKKPTPPAENQEGEVVTVTVGDVRSKSGTSAKGPWTRFYFSHAGDFYSTFDDKLAEVLRGLNGQEAELRIQRTDKGINILGIQSDSQEGPVGELAPQDQ
jgi:hypothetical protein